LLVISKVRMGKRTPGRDASTRFVDEHALEKVDSFSTEIRENGCDADFGPLRKGRLKVRQLIHSRPNPFVRGAHYPEDLEDLINLRVTREYRVPL
jgi:hypothetical protein